MVDENKQPNQLGIIMETITPSENTSDNSDSQETKISRLDATTPSGHSAAPFSVHCYGGSGEIKCTDGDDRWEFADVNVASSDGKIIASFPAWAAEHPGFDRVTKTAEMRANANLFLAAPEMLRLLKSIDSGGLSLMRMTEIRAAIEIAEGRQNG
jgi:hypothetical protein